ncbi:uncharacterized protein B0T15DRAFT_145397 [Chaetomium strumarium]|uniref:Secreted protein n=1 Tax=Chaetomium strumarium TaxID=1170767 RepID=A0AAJ0GUS8_9PEZI|nr:hypothetical protein B0T15DRAFT_145397 [Chaetomium strumarium]
MLLTASLCLAQLQPARGLGSGLTSIMIMICRACKEGWVSSWGKALGWSCFWFAASAEERPGLPAGYLKDHQHAAGAVGLHTPGRAQGRHYRTGIFTGRRGRRTTPTHPRMSICRPCDVSSDVPSCAPAETGQIYPVRDSVPVASV